VHRRLRRRVAARRGRAPDARPTDGFTIVTRASGAHQWAYKGKPLYGYMFDGGPGSVSGDGEDGVWHVAKP
jgi:predicted lipoprotein with Yx(FWY)xxD motif